FDIIKLLRAAEPGGAERDQHLREPDDRVERRAQLVAHRRKKFRLSEARALRGILGDAQRLVRRLALGPQLKRLETAVENGQQLARVAGFVDVVVGAVAQSLDRRLAVDMRGHDDADQVRPLDLEAGEEIDAARGAEPKIEERNLSIEALQALM